MSDEATTIFCSSCQAQLAEAFLEPESKDEPCPHCGSVRRLVRIESEERIERAIREEVRTKLRNAGGGKPFLLEQSGDNWSFSRDKWVELDRRIDRANDEYWERVVDPDTGEVIHECKEPLSQHQGHGSARRSRAVSAEIPAEGSPPATGE